jgi:hypothetical protein
MPALTRNDDHEYFLDERRILGMTEALKLVGAIDNSWYTPTGRDDGTSLHDQCAASARRRLHQRPDPIRSKHEAMLAFCYDFRVRFEQVEPMLVDPDLQLAGEPDALVTLHRPGYPSGRCVLDWKGGGPESWHPLQLTGYALLDGAAAIGVNVYLTETGYRPRFIQVDDWRATVLAMITTAHWRRAHS